MRGTMNHEITDDGGPAFPFEFKFGDGTAKRGEGMSLRDWLAQNASEVDVAEMRYGDRDYRGCRSTQYSRQEARYRHADAMLKARKQTP